MTESHQEAIRSEFERAAATFAERTKGRFDDMQVVDFARVQPGQSVAEIGAGTGNFLSLFDGVAAALVAVDITPGMLTQARARFPEMLTVLGDGTRLPLRKRSIDLVASAQALHHVPEPVPFLKEMRRVCKPEGRVLVVDQIAREHAEEALAMNELDLLRDPSHAVSRPPSAFRIIVQAAGLRIEDERIWEGTNTLKNWMWPGEFPEERIQAVREFIETRGHETGMEWRREGDDWVFTRRRIMLLASVL